MVCAPVRSIIPSLKLGDYLSVQALKPCSVSLVYIDIHPAIHHMLLHISGDCLHDRPTEIHIWEKDSVTQNANLEILTLIWRLTCMFELTLHQYLLQIP